MTSNPQNITESRFRCIVGGGQAVSKRGRMVISTMQGQTRSSATLSARHSPEADLFHPCHPSQSPALRSCVHKAVRSLYCPDVAWSLPVTHLQTGRASENT